MDQGTERRCQRREEQHQGARQQHQQGVEDGSRAGSEEHETRARRSGARGTTGSEDVSRAKHHAIDEDRSCFAAGRRARERHRAVQRRHIQLRQTASRRLLESQRRQDLV